MRIISLLFLLFTSGLVQGCSQTQEVQAAGPAPSTEVDHHPSGQRPGNDSDPGGSGKPGGPTPTESMNPREPELLLVTGGNIPAGRSLHFLSSMAREAFPKKIGNSQLNYWHPQVFSSSPRGVAIAQPRFGEGPQTLQLLNFVTGHSYTLYRAPDLNHRLSTPSVAPSESWIAFRVEGPKYPGGKILLIHVANENVVEIPGEGDREPRFSPDGKRISWIRNTKKTWTVFSAPLAAEGVGAPLAIVTSLIEEPLSYFQVSPDGMSYFYLKQVGKFSKLFLRSKSVEGEISVVGDKTSVYEPTWSRDGDKILFWSESRESQSIQIYDVKNGLIETLQNIFVPSSDNEGLARRSGEPCICPAFSKDMSEVYYTSHMDYWYSVFKISLGSIKTTVRMTDANFSPSYYCPQVISGLKP